MQFDLLFVLLITLLATGWLVGWLGWAASDEFNEFVVSNWQQAAVLLAPKAPCQLYYVLMVRGDPTITTSSSYLICGVADPGSLGPPFALLSRFDLLSPMHLPGQGEDFLGCPASKWITNSIIGDGNSQRSPPLKSSYVDKISWASFAWNGLIEVLTPFSSKVTVLFYYYPPVLSHLGLTTVAFVVACCGSMHVCNSQVHGFPRQQWDNTQVSCQRHGAHQDDPDSRLLI